jgi:outer membrane protein TolC
MSLSSLKGPVRNLIAMLLVVAFPSGMWAQDAQTAPSQTTTSQASSSQSSGSSQASLPQAPSAHRRFEMTNYAKPRGYFPNPLAPYLERQIASPDLTNSAKIDQLMRDGKIYLSMDDAVALALENNLDIAIQRYNFGIADTDVMRAKSGGSGILGVPFGVVQNTPGGGVGGLSGPVGSGPGGTSAATGGIGSGTAGFSGSTEGLGPLITSFDPIISGTLQWDRAHSVATNIFGGAPIISQGSTTGDFSYQQGFHSGTNLLVGFNNSRVGSNSSFNTYSPSLNSSFQFRLTQHLLQGFGLAANDRLIRITKNNREITDVAFRLQIITTVDQIENLYWNLVFAYENVRVAQESLAFAQKTLSDNQKQVQIGSLAPIEVVRAQNTVAADQQSLIQAQTNLDLQQLLMKNALSRTLQDPTLASAEVIPTTTMALPDQEAAVPTEELINQALQHRAELVESRIDLTNRDLSNKAIKNSLLPSLDLFAYYGGSGLGGTQNPLNLCPSDPTKAFFGCSPAPGVSAVGYSDTLNQLVNSTASDKGMGVTLTIPLRNRQAQSVAVRSQLEYRQAQMRLQQVENQVRIEVRNAQFAVTQNRAAVKAAEAAVELAKQSLDAEQKKFNLGASTSTLVLQNQSGLATAESNLVSAMAAYEKAEVELDRATGLLIEHAGIDMGDAEKGEVTHAPKVPFVAPRAETQSVMPPQ